MSYHPPIKVKFCLPGMCSTVFLHDPAATSIDAAAEAIALRYERETQGLTLTDSDRESIRAKLEAAISERSE